MLYAIIFFILGLIKLHYSDQKVLDEKLSDSSNTLREGTEFADMIERAIKEGVIH